jgi:REP element-mobilizing transposase RayT
MRRRFGMRIYGYVIMPEHAHLLVNELPQATLAEAIHFLKLSFAKRLHSQRGTMESSSFWQKRYYDRNVRDAREFTVKLRYLHRNPVRRGLVKEPADWKWSSFRHYALRKLGSSKSSPRGQRRIERQKTSPRECFSTQVSVERADANLGHPAMHCHFPSGIFIHVSVQRSLASKGLPDASVPLPLKPPVAMAVFPKAGTFTS